MTKLSTNNKQYYTQIIKAYNNCAHVTLCNKCFIDNLYNITQDCESLFNNASITVKLLNNINTWKSL